MYIVVLSVIKNIEVKWSRYRPGVAQRVSRGIALLFHDRGTRRGWVVNSTPRPHFTPRKDPVPIVQEVGWAPGPVWTGGKFRPHRDSIPDRPARSQSLYRLSYRAHVIESIHFWKSLLICGDPVLNLVVRTYCNHWALKGYATSSAGEHWAKAQWLVRPIIQCRIHIRR